MPIARRFLAASAVVLCAAAAPEGGGADAPPTLRIVFFTPADLKPPAGVSQRLTQVADATERFIVSGMKHWDYAPANERMFRRNADGSAEILFVTGDQPRTSGRYDKPGFAPEVIEKATRQYGIPGRNDLWWVFVYLGDPPTRSNEYKGRGDSVRGGWAMVNYSSEPGQIRPEQSLAEGFNARFTLKGCVHELGHAFGLPHIGPNPGKGLGNTLMGPNMDAFNRAGSRGKDRVYMTEASAAMLWKHPLFSGTAADRSTLPGVRLEGYRATFDRKRKRVSLVGRLVSDHPAHSVVVLDDTEKVQGSYWSRSYVGRLKADGSFQVAIDEPAPADGLYRIVFCFENGVVTGDGKGHGDQSAIVKPYRFVGGGLQFGSTAVSPTRPGETSIPLTIFGRHFDDDVSGDVVPMAVRRARHPDRPPLGRGG